MTSQRRRQFKERPVQSVARRERCDPPAPRQSFPLRSSGYCRRRASRKDRAPVETSSLVRWPAAERRSRAHAQASMRAHVVEIATRQRANNREIGHRRSVSSRNATSSSSLAFVVSRVMTLTLSKFALPACAPVARIAVSTSALSSNSKRPIRKRECRDGGARLNVGRHDVFNTSASGETVLRVRPLRRCDRPNSGGQRFVVMLHKVIGTCKRLPATTRSGVRSATFAPPTGRLERAV